VSLPCSQELHSDQDERSAHFHISFLSVALTPQRGLIPFWWLPNILYEVLIFPLCCMPHSCYIPVSSHDFQSTLYSPRVLDFQSTLYSPRVLDFQSPLYSLEFSWFPIHIIFPWVLMISNPHYIPLSSHDYQSTLYSPWVLMISNPHYILLSSHDYQSTLYSLEFSWFPIHIIFPLSSHDFQSTLYSPWVLMISNPHYIPLSSHDFQSTLYSLEFSW
jgi:hypothetical protein